MTAEATLAGCKSGGLAKLRSDIKIDVNLPTGERFPEIIVSDPLRGTYFRMTWPESGLFLHWQNCRTEEELTQTLIEQHGFLVSPDILQAVLAFAYQNELTEADEHGSWQRNAAKLRADKHSLFHTLIHNYLFFRMPLINPEPFLQWLLPRVTFVFCRGFWAVIACLALSGFYLSAQQWSAVVTALGEAVRLEGLAVYAVAILCLKAIHELGHALAAARFGCRVPSMGVAFMLGTPVFYTDTTDSWRLTKRSERLTIVFAGVAAEFIVAALAIFIWPFLPAGLVRQTCFSFATVAIVMSLIINLNPFMRFDGYYALSDYLRIPNLQTRAFNFLSWRLREILFGLKHCPPEDLPYHRSIILTTYAVLTVIYRLVLYLGIAVIVYYMAGKAIGILLGGFEVAVFIAMPVYYELLEWWKLRREIINGRRIILTGLVLFMATALLVLPWMSTVEAPAVMLAENEEAVYPPFPARLVKVHVSEGQFVKNGDVLFSFQSGDVEHRYRKALLQIRLFENLASRLTASDQEREDRFAILGLLDKAREEFRAAENLLAELKIRAPFAGIVRDVDNEISEPLFLDQKRPLARLVAAGTAKAKAYISSTDVNRVNVGSKALFVPDDPSSPSVIVTLLSVAPASNGHISEQMLTERYGGKIPVGERENDVIAKTGWFEAEFSSGTLLSSSLQSGVVKIDASPVSPLSLAWAQIVRVLVREQGF